MRKPNSTFSSVVSQLKSAASPWNTTPRSIPGPLTRSPRIRISPAEGERNPATMRNTVDFPQPLGPSRQKNSPGEMEKLTSLKGDVFAATIGPGSLEKGAASHCVPRRPPWQRARLRVANHAHPHSGYCIAMARSR